MLVQRNEADLHVCVDVLATESIVNSGRCEISKIRCIYAHSESGKSLRIYTNDFQGKNDEQSSPLEAIDSLTHRIVASQVMLNWIKRRNKQRTNWPRINLLQREAEMRLLIPEK